MRDRAHRQPPRLWRLGLLLLAAALAVLARPAAAQDRPEVRTVTIVNADSVVGEVVDGQRLRRLFGRVHLQQDSTDLRADRATQYLDRDLIVFEGRVSIADPGDTLTARRISYESAVRVGRAVGNVRLSDAESVLFSDSLTFFRTERRAVFDAPVRLVEREGGGVLTSRRGTYFTETKEAFFQGDVRLEDSTSVLTSQAGRYGVEDKRAEFTGDVRLEHERSTRVAADSLTHYRETQRTEARGRVALLRFGDEDDGAAPDTLRRNLLFGGLLFHDEPARYSRVERGSDRFNPLLARLETNDEGRTDTLLVRASLFEAFQYDEARPDTLRPLPPGASLQRFLARGDAHLVDERLAALADSVVVERLRYGARTDTGLGEVTPTEPGAPPSNTEPLAPPDAEPLEVPPPSPPHPLTPSPLGEAPPSPLDEVRLYREPIAWLSARGSSVVTQLTGDTLRARGRGEALDSLTAHGRAFAVRPDSALGRLNQVRGRQMLALFRDDSLRAIRVWPNAEAVLFRADSLGRLEGAVRVSSDSLSLTFDGDDLRRVSALRGIEGQYLDAPLVAPELALDGLRYTPERRPTREALLDGRPPLVDPFLRAPPRAPPERPPDLPETAPDLPETAPDLQETAPDLQETAPDLQETAPDAEEIAPDLQETTPDAEEIAPDLQEMAPGLPETAPGLPETAPDARPADARLAPS